MTSFLEICNTHREMLTYCGPCLETAATTWSFDKDNHQLTKDLRHLKAVTMGLEEKLRNLETSYNDIANRSIITDSHLPVDYVKKHSLKEYLLNLQLPSNLFGIIRDVQSSASFLLQSGAFDTSKKCACGNDMKIVNDLGRENYAYLCECGKATSLFEGTIWEESNLPFDKILLFLFLWIMNLSIRDITQVLGANRASMIDLDIKLTKIVSDHYLRVLPKFRGIVEIDESCFRKSSKPLNFGAAPNDKWVFGLYERESKRVYMEVVPKRTTQYLFPIIKNHCEVGTTIISDQWAAYNKLPEYGFPHYTVDHSRFFVNPQNREIHTQHIEISWCWAKYDIKRKNRQMNNLQEHLNVFCWKRQFKNRDDKLSEYADIMKALFEVLRNHDQATPMEKKPEDIEDLTRLSNL